MGLRDVNDILERLCNLLRTEARTFGVKSGLQPVQLEALSYLTQCNRYSDTPQAVAEYLGLTKGTVSQTLKVLQQRGLLTKHPDQQDKRLVHMKTTLAGRQVIEDGFPAQGLGRALADKNTKEVSRLAEGLQSLLRDMQRANGLKTFAACHTCRFNERRDGGYFCGLTQEPLSNEEVTLICREHEYPQAVD